MALTKWKPKNYINGGITRLFDEDFPLLRWKSFFDEDLPLVTFPKFSFDLAVDVYEKDGNVIIEMNLPGIDPEEIETIAGDDYITISGRREEKKEVDEKCYCSREIRRGFFKRTVELPCCVKKEKALAEYKDGVLKLIIPKEEKKEGTIKVKVIK